MLCRRPALLCAALLRPAQVLCSTTCLLACLLSRQVLEMAGKMVAPGVTTDEIDKAVHKMIIEVGCPFLAARKCVRVVMDAVACRKLAPQAEGLARRRGLRLPATLPARSAQ